MQARWFTLVLLLAFFATPVWGDDPVYVGDVIQSQQVAQYVRASKTHEVPMGELLEIYVDDDLVTGNEEGRLRIFFDDRTDIQLFHGAKLSIRPYKIDDPDLKEEFKLNLDSMARVLVSKSTSCARLNTKNATFECSGTEFLVEYDRASNTTTVIGIHGIVTLRNLQDLESKVERQFTASVVGSGRPSEPRRLDDATFESYLARFEFIGGGAQESLAIGNDILEGRRVLVEDRAPWLPVVPAEDPEPKGPADLVHPVFPVFGEVDVEF